MPNEFARRLRKDLTDAEQFVWKRIRGGQISGFKFRRQHPLGPFVADFICLERKLVLELDGGQHAERADHDERRSAWLAAEGYRVVRFWNHEAFEDWDVIEQELWRLLTDDGRIAPARGKRGKPAETPFALFPPPLGGREQS